MGADLPTRRDEELRETFGVPYRFPDFCPECQGELPEHGQGCGWVAGQMADHAYDVWKENR